ncbi:MAG TPA: recombinase family protein [Ruminiclostridium sp.]
MRAAIYSRKSKFTGKGESVENQIQMCKEYAIKFLGCINEDFLIYEDEGFSGGNTNRPQFQRMLNDARIKQLDMIICYRLDRISRDVSDFSQLINELERYNVSFISVREQFDTSKPMGRAMMYVASVFSQLERETIAERIRDNMMQLAKTGRWLGGTTPTGYKSEVVVTTDSSGKEHRMSKLVSISEEVSIIELIYNKYISFKSITMVEKYLAQNRIVTKNGVDFGRFSIRFILSNPVYAIADENLFQYLSTSGYDMNSNLEEFNGINGLMGYNKTSQAESAHSERYRNCSEWVFAVGLHPGIVPSEAWIETQELLLQNKCKSYRRVKNTKSLLSGIIRCANCGSFMRPKASKRLNENGEAIFYYLCEMKEKSGKLRCSITNIKGNVLDDMVMKELKHIVMDYPPICDEIYCNGIRNWHGKDKIKSEIQLLQDKRDSSDLKIKKLIKLISKEENDDIQVAMLYQLRKENDDKEAYNTRLFELSSVDTLSDISNENLELLAQSLLSSSESFWNIMSVDIKRRMLKSIVKNAVWDGVKLDVFLRGEERAWANSQNVSVLRG